MNLLKKNGDIDKTKAINFINTELSLQLNNSNTTCKKLEKKMKWWLEIDNSKFKMDYHLLLVDIDERCIHYFEIPANKITEPEKIFEQQDKKNNRKKSHIHLMRDNNPDFNNHYKGIHFSFGVYYKERVQIPESDVYQDQNQNNNNNQPPKAKTSKSKNTYNPNSDNVLKLVSNIRLLINEINEYRGKNRKHPIFIDNNSLPLWTKIEKPCTSENNDRFIVFTLNLYILIYETTRVETKNNRKKEKYFYDFLLPDKFLEKGTETREFINIVGSLRHKYAHKAPEYGVPIKTMLYADILKKLLGDSNKEEDYSIMQIELLKRFENAMKKLLEIVKNDR